MTPCKNGVLKPGMEVIGQHIVVNIVFRPKLDEVTVTMRQMSTESEGIFKPAYKLRVASEDSSRMNRAYETHYDIYSYNDPIVQVFILFSAIKRCISQCRNKRAVSALIGTCIPLIRRVLGFGTSATVTYKLENPKSNPLSFEALDTVLGENWDVLYNNSGDADAFDTSITSIKFIAQRTFASSILRCQIHASQSKVSREINPRTILRRNLFYSNEDIQSRNDS